MAERTRLGVFGTPGGLAWHSGGFVGAVDPTVPGNPVRGITAISALCLSGNVPVPHEEHSFYSQICRWDWRGSRKTVEEGPFHSPRREELDQEKPVKVF